MSGRDGGPAYPGTDDHGMDRGGWPGMTLRDYFAIRAMVVMLDWEDWDSPDQVAKAAYLQANAMLKARDE